MENVDERSAYRLDAHNKEHWVFIDAGYGVKGLSIGIHPTGDWPWVGEKNPDRVEGDGEEMPE